MKRNGFCFAKKNKKRKWDTLLPTCPVPARQNLTSPLTCQTGLPSQIERVGSNPLFAQNLTSEVSLAKSYGFGLRAVQNQGFLGVGGAGANFILPEAKKILK